MTKTAAIAAYGDFQTPDALAAQVCGLLKTFDFRPGGILEPTCGVGAFVAAAAAAFDAPVLGVELNAAHLSQACGRKVAGVAWEQADFFAADWSALCARLPKPLLILGNPPWVTTSGLGALGSTNAPVRTSAGRRGIDAITGKSNFDISEWMIGRYLEWLGEGPGMIAVLCKTATARKAVFDAWSRGVSFKTARIYDIDSAAHFGVAVAACLLVLETGGAGDMTCTIYDDFAATAPRSRIGRHGDILLSDTDAFVHHRHLLGEGPHWRSGIKHDCAAVMELTPLGDAYRNGQGETVHLEPDYLYPLMKSSDLANGRAPRSVMLVPQQSVGEDTADIARRAPKTWAYLQAHVDRLAARRSRIYRGRPPFSIFGVGAYTFAMWKVAISGFYKRLEFACVGPHAERPVVFDDTVTLLPCADEAEARQLCALLNSAAARGFYESMISWSDKRPITAALLRRLDLNVLAQTPALARASVKLAASAFAPASMNP